MAWLTSLAASLLEKLVSSIAVKLMELYRGKAEKDATEADIDNRVALLKDAYKKAFDGNPVTPQQKEELKHAIRQFINGNNPAGGM